MRNKFHGARAKSKSNCIPRSDSNMHVEYAFENFYYYCLEKFEKGELK